MIIPLKMVAECVERFAVSGSRIAAGAMDEMLLEKGGGLPSTIAAITAFSGGSLSNSYG